MRNIRTLRRLLVKNIAATKNKQSRLEQFENIVLSLETNFQMRKEEFQKVFQTYPPAWIKIEPSFIRGKKSLLRLREFTSFSKELNNLKLLIILCLQDVMLLVKSPTAKLSKLERNFEARLVAMHCYDFTKKLPELLGILCKDGSKYYHQGALLRIRECKKSIDRLRNQNIQQWKEIRDTCIAHRDNDAFRQLSNIESLDSNRFEENANDLCKIMEGIIRALAEEIGARSSKEVEILRQASNLCKEMFNNIESLVRGDPEWKV